MKRDANPEKGLEALDQCEYMVLAMTDGEGKPYCIPLNGVRVREKIYFHCTKAGEKVDCLRTHPQVCLTAVGHQRVIQAIYETEYQCAVVRGTAGEVTDETEMREALWALCRKYSPDCLERVEGLQRPGLTRGAYVDSICLCLRVLCGSDRRLGQAGHGGGQFPSGHGPAHHCGGALRLGNGLGGGLQRRSRGT